MGARVCSGRCKSGVQTSGWAAKVAARAPKQPGCKMLSASSNITSLPLAVPSAVAVRSKYDDPSPLLLL